MTTYYDGAITTWWLMRSYSTRGCCPVLLDAIGKWLIEGGAKVSADPLTWCAAPDGGDVALGTMLFLPSDHCMGEYANDVAVGCMLHRGQSGGCAV